MSVQLIQEQATETENLQLEDEWTPTPPPRDLIFDDGSPWESNRHRIAMNVLISAVTLACQNREDYFAGGNMFVYYSSEQARNRDYKGPDFFVALNVDGTKERQGWVVWEEGLILRVGATRARNRATGTRTSRSRGRRTATS